MIKWTVETRKLSELKAYELNPRRITEKGLNDLIKSLELFGLAEPIVINREEMIIGGHARVQALKRIKGKGAKVEVYVPDRLVDEKEVQELCVRLNKNEAGQFDFDVLANQYDPRDLVAWDSTRIGDSTKITFFSLDVINGATIKVLADDGGRTPSASRSGLSADHQRCRNSARVMFMPYRVGCRGRRE